MIIPEIAINLGCVLPYHGSYFAAASLAEPMCCIIGAYHANYHTTQYVYEHRMGVKPGGNIALLACAGPMGIGAIDYAINGGIQPSRVVVVDIDDKRLAQVEKLLPVELAASKGIELVYVNTKGMSDPVQMLRALTDDAGFDDVFVYAAVPSVVEMADELLAEDGCMNFFAGPTDKNFKVPFNFYNVHYNSTHVVGTSGGSTDDMKEAITLSATGQLQPSFMVTHIGGLDAVPETVLNLPDIPGGKKLIYNGVTMPLTAIADFAEKAKPIRCLKSWRGWLRKRTASGMSRPRNICWRNLALISGGRAMMSLAWPLFRVTEQAALAAWPQIGCGDKNKIDGLAVTAMRQALNDVAFVGEWLSARERLTMRRCCGLAKRWAKAMGQKSISRLIRLKAPGWWRWGRAMRWQSWPSPHEAACYTLPICI